jgi:hypothetical protein
MTQRSMFKEARTSSNRCLARLHATPIVMPHTPEAQLLQSTDRPADVILTGSMSLSASSYRLTGVSAHRDSTYGSLQPENHRASHCTQPHPLCVPLCVPFSASRFKLGAYGKTWHTVFSTTTIAQPGLSKVSVRSRSLPHLHVTPEIRLFQSFTAGKLAQMRVNRQVVSDGYVRVDLFTFAKMVSFQLSHSEEYVRWLCKKLLPSLQVLAMPEALTTEALCCYCEPLVEYL